MNLMIVVFSGRIDQSAAQCSVGLKDIVRPHMVNTREYVSVLALSIAKNIQTYDQYMQVLGINLELYKEFINTERKKLNEILSDIEDKEVEDIIELIVYKEKSTQEIFAIPEKLQEIKVLINRIYDQCDDSDKEKIGNCQKLIDEAIISRQQIRRISEIRECLRKIL